MIKVYYIQHSTVAVELDHTFLLFDYFPAGVFHEIEFHGKLPDFPADKNCYVFSSHRHGDHFDLSCLKWAAERENLTYILSKDIRLGNNYLTKHGIDPAVKKRIQFVSPENKYDIDNLRIETIRSTDEGVAFYVEAEGKAIYHSGDHHWWNWGERGEIYCNAMGAAYKRELRRLEDKHIDLAFVVLDGRLGEGGYALGMEYFLQKMNADLVFPIHLWNEFELVPKFKKRASVAPYREKIVDVDRENIVFEVE